MGDGDTDQNVPDGNSKLSLEFGSPRLEKRGGCSWIPFLGQVSISFLFSDETSPREYSRAAER
jgi:hypothetical protein